MVVAHEWNFFFDTSPGEVSTEKHMLPRRVYARIESVETDEKGRPVWVRLDCVDANWFDDPQNSLSERATYFRNIPLAAIEFDPSISSYAAGMASLASAVHDVDDFLTSHPDIWLQLDLAQPEGFECEVYLNLRGAPLYANASASQLSSKTIAALRKTFDLRNYFSPAPPTVIQGVLASIGSCDGVVVYDVGQGSSAGVVDSSIRPLLYADVGGGVTRNRHTYPSALRDFCSCTKAPIVLSHWDWDHWSSAGFKPNRWLRTHTWIAPMQKALGPTHISFAQAIDTLGKLHLWDGGKQPAIQAGPLTLERCSASGRNHSGIALIVDGPSTAGSILLPGDARYSAIPSGLRSFDSVVVPHHGADMKSRRTPISPQKGHSRAVYSFGPNNKFSSGKNTISHPAHVTRSDHQRNLWIDQTITPVLRGDVRHTADRSTTAPILGHVYVAWSSLWQLPTTMCAPHSSCDLSPTQY